MNCFCLLTRVDRTLHTFSSLTIRVASMGLLLLALPHGAKAAAADQKAAAAAPTCGFSDSDFDTATDVKALDEYREAMAQLLKQEKFEALDCLADAARAGKTRFSGGAWKLRNLYVGLDSPRPGHPTQEDWQQHMELVERWRQQYPRSITAPIAVAESLVRYAWDARGSGYSNSVSDSGWKLFGERLAKAKEILEQNSALASKCPDWYLAMELVAQAQNWHLDQATALLQRAAAFEPGYQYYYRVHVNHVLPQWGGDEGDAASFAEETANRVGGEAGDGLYFLIAQGILCACQQPEFPHFSWPRLQSGFAALEKKYGPSLFDVNSFALMAAKSSDWVAADEAFKRIGDSWSEDTWKTEAWFTQNKNTAAQLSPIQMRSRAGRKEAADNMKTPEGAAYKKDLEQKMVSMERACLEQAAGDMNPMDLLLQVGKNGTADLAETDKQPNRFTFCVEQALYVSFTNKQTPFTPPPHAGYWVVLQIDPRTVTASAK